MRFLGNKESMTDEIRDILKKKHLLNKKLTFFDAFCGTGAVADSLKDQFNIIINDSLTWCTIYSQARIDGESIKFENLNFNPFEYFNQPKISKKGFFYQTYSPGGSDRMYFSTENAGKIDFIRHTIQSWYDTKLVSKNEYMFLLASLIESMSKVANVAGVYGAFLKKWDPRALKPMEFIPVPFKKIKNRDLQVFNDKIENIIGTVDTDILYLDPPYTQNQYGTQYHIFETLIKDDHPSVSKVTGSRPTGPMRSDWSKEYKAQILFDKILSETKAKYVMLSYNNDGIMSKTFIESALKRYGKAETFELKKINYKKYRNFKTKTTNEHFEYLFFIELKRKIDVTYESPLNFTGSKYQMLGELSKYFPQNITTVVDIFGGGFNFGANYEADTVIYNDINFIVKDLIEMIAEKNTYDLIRYIHKIIKRFDLSAGNKESYVAARAYYNNLPNGDKDPQMLYTIVMYGFQQQLRFNSKLEFNNPVGMRWFNDKVLEKLISFSRHIKTKNLVFESKSFEELYIPQGEDTLVYLDPPYLLTTGSYNDGKRGFKGWNRKEEKQLFSFMENLNENGNRIMFSYVVKHKGKVNQNLLNWLDTHKSFNLFELSGIKGRKRNEILITNYDI